MANETTSAPSGTLEIWSTVNSVDLKPESHRKPFNHLQPERSEKSQFPLELKFSCSQQFRLAMCGLMFWLNRSAMQKRKKYWNQSSFTGLTHPSFVKWCQVHARVSVPNPLYLHARSRIWISNSASLTVQIRFSSKFTASVEKAIVVALPASEFD